MYNNINVNEVAKNPSLLVSILGFINPAVALPVAVIGIFSFAMYKAFGTISDEREENERLVTANEALKTEVERLEYDDYEDEEPYDEPLDNGTLTVEPTVESTVIEPLDTIEGDEAFKKEMIRRTMSELGKRSAAKRRAKKNST